MVDREIADPFKKMSYALTIRKEAEQDIDEQFTYYEEKREGLGHDYLLCIEEALDKFQRNPLTYRKIHNELRRLSIKRFPHRIFISFKTTM